MRKTIVAIGAAMGMAVSMAGTASAATTTIPEPTVIYSAGDPVVETTSLDGVGSLFISTPLSGDKATVGVTDAGNITLGELESLSYRSLREAGALQQTVSLNITVSPWAGTFVYEPVYDSAYTVETGVWQTFESIGDTGGWWKTGDGPTFTSFAEQIEGFEDSVITSISVNQGSGNPGLMTYTDWVEVNGERFDFEPLVLTKDDCKDGGWETNFDVGQYKNQGQCVSEFARAE
ncbi:hypothetical protein [Ornithinimicrobium sediminis]|uniref:hypothetical protein n=1 Tax=Ornithinimicrobium sediminis TaxID=2904603 RepID=UPI001E506F57|nr:hypothetical protein [Ornithinimicrobium sediminis]MCE0488427.1 hypothetical protein [Ornithinimicrobium sediminis]